MHSTYMILLLGASALAHPLAIRAESSSSTSALATTSATPSAAATGSITTSAGGGLNDLDILNFALTAEHLESAFYSQGLSLFDANAFTAAGISAGFRDNLAQIGKDEASHVTFLEAAISGSGGTPVQPCTYNFGLTNVQTFVAISSVLEGIGASAYLGAAPSVSSKSILSAAASIMSVESRHSSFVRAILNEIPDAQPLDTPLSPNEVFSLASLFITSCPSSNPPLPFKAFPTLTTTSKGPLSAGQTITVATDAQLSGTLSAAFLALAGPIFVPITQANDGFTVTIPQGFSGQTYMVVTNSQTEASDASVVAGPLVVELK